MDALYLPPIWPEEQRFSLPPSLEPTGPPNLPDDVIEILAEGSKFKKAFTRTSNTIKRYVLPLRATYPHWSAYTPQHVRPEAVESHDLDSYAISFSRTAASQTRGEKGLGQLRRGQGPRGKVVVVGGA
ncbi:hypothetical protein N0V87_000261 [Didymella glomerata]|uniref:Uncharacterized protein n=1 Tax=Didymella glomerata TaxID=749621 RepID=A0A9W8X997_9PLEO|nr:hypothetical protein N0V87_000261 [Didymella glomerata]